MKILRKLFVSVCMTVICGSLYAFGGHSISISNFRSEDSYYDYTHNSIDEVSIKFSGYVSEGCKAIRVLWAPDEEDIMEHLLSGMKKVPGSEVDDFILKKYSPGSSSFEYNASVSLSNLKAGTNNFMFIAKFNDGMSM